jgi:hypothetical protein
VLTRPIDIDKFVSIPYGEIMKNVLCTFLFIIILFAGCEQRPSTLLVTDVVPASQVAIPNFDKLQRAAENGDAQSQYKLGELYADGLGVKKNHRTAMIWYNNAAVQGHAAAQYSLGWMYFNGTGVVHDFKEGCKWMQAAARQGIPEASEFHRRQCP